MNIKINYYLVNNKVSCNLRLLLKIFLTKNILIKYEQFLIKYCSAIRIKNNTCTAYTQYTVVTVVMY